MDRDLFGNEIAPKRKTPKPSGHAWPPGSGPEGRTCKECVHYTLVHWDRSYRKCKLARSKWTRGPGSDIRASDPACLKFEAIK
jgi:hypothetical protein